MDKELAFLTAALPDEAGDSWQTYPFFLCGVAGYACYLAWLFTHLVTPAFVPDVAGGGHVFPSFLPMRVPVVFRCLAGSGSVPV